MFFWYPQTCEHCVRQTAAVNVNPPPERSLAHSVSQVCVHPTSSCPSTDLLLRESNTVGWGGAALLTAQDGKNSQMTFESVLATFFPQI